MAQTVIALFENEDTARTAWRELARAGFGPGFVSFVDREINRLADNLMQVGISGGSGKTCGSPGARRPAGPARTRPVPHEYIKDAGASNSVEALNAVFYAIFRIPIT